MMKGQQRVIIENVTPEINCGQFPAKRVINERIKIEADIYSDSHDVLSAELLYKHTTEDTWHREEMKYHINDRWTGDFVPEKTGIWQYSLQAWVNHFKTWHRDIIKKINASADFQVDLLVGAQMIKETLSEYPDIATEETSLLKEMAETLTSPGTKPEEKVQHILDHTLYAILIKYPVKKRMKKYEKTLTVEVDRERANFSTWYEVFPRSLGKNGYGTFEDCIAFLPYVSDMGFDVLYLPPIHPIGETNRKITVGEKGNCKPGTCAVA